MSKKKAPALPKVAELTIGEKIDVSVLRKKSGMPRSFIKTYNRSRNSKSAAIKSMCSECCGYIRKMVRECPSYGCPLWTHRPYQNDDDEIEDVAAESESVESEESEAPDDIDEIKEQVIEIEIKQENNVKKKMSRAELLEALK